MTWNWNCHHCHTGPHTTTPQRMIVHNHTARWFCSKTCADNYIAPHIHVKA